MPRLFAPLRNERGASLAVMAVMVTGLLAVMALAIDLGMLYKSHGEARRAAEAAALAGASAFRDIDRTLPASEPLARQRAIAYAELNYMTGGPIDSNEVSVQVIRDSAKVRVWVRREEVGTWFARVFGMGSVPIQAKAAAVLHNAGVAKCVKPFAIPDYWDDPTDDNIVANRWMDNDGKQGGNNKNQETWDWDPSENDRYERFDDGDPGGSVNATGLGSDFRNNTALDGKRYYRDRGRPVVIKHSDPQASPQPGFFYPWVIPGTGPGGAAYRESIWGCNTAPIQLNTDYNPDECQGTGPSSNCDVNKPGNMIGPTKQGLDSLFAMDPNAHWVETCDAGGYCNGVVAGSSYGDAWQSSPRVVIVPLMDPNYIGNGRTQLRFNNLGLFFIDEFDNAHKAVTAHYIGPAPGTDEGPTEGSLIKVLRLVE